MSQRRCVSDSAFHQCASTSPSTQPLPDAGSATCLDLQAIDVHETRKMRDDSKIHHIVDDLVSRPRKLVGHYHHPLPKAELNEVDTMESEEPGHRTAPVYLRHMLSHTQWLQMSQSRAVGPTSQDTSGSPVNGTKSHVSGLKISKSVSFGKVENVLDGEIRTTNEDDGSQQAQDSDASSVKSDAVECGDDDDIGIVFTVPATASIREDVGYKAEEEIVPTAVELCLPWRRNTGRAPMSSVETHMVADGCNPVLADGGNWMKGLTHSLSDSQSNSSSRSKCGGVYDPLNVTLDEDNTDQKTPLCSPHDAALAINCECSVPSDEKPPDAKVKDVVDLAPHKKTSRHSELQTQLQLPPSGVRLTMHRRPTRCGSVPSFMDYACRAVEQARVGAAASLLPWRYISDERAIPDQQAPRPLVAMIARESPSQSFVDAVSTYPQPSCQSFRLSEAESRHSEPVHVQHVIDITSAGHRVASTPSEPDDDQSSDILCNLEELDSHERICMWLDTLSESNDEVPPDMDFDKVS